MAALRTPETGCPWDLAQTFATIAPYTIEEAYEVADAITRNNTDDLKDELGDLLLQVVYHSRIAEEDGLFRFDDVADAITHKMIRRHPHVFGSEDERRAGAEPGFWDRIKQQERAAKRTDAKNSESTLALPSILADIPANLPALMRAIKLQNKAAKVGFDWPNLAPVFEKLREELAELEEALVEPSDQDAKIEHTANDAIEEEFGDLLFVIANVARHLKLDPETALSRANQKFIARFHYIEQALAGKTKALGDATLEEMDELWDEAKRKGINGRAPTAN